MKHTKAFFEEIRLQEILLKCSSAIVFIIKRNYLKVTQNMLKVHKNKYTLLSVKLASSTFVWCLCNGMYVITIHDWHSNQCTLVICRSQYVLTEQLSGYHMIFVYDHDMLWTLVSTSALFSI